MENINSNDFNNLSQNKYNWEPWNLLLEWNTKTYQVRPYGTEKPLEGILINPLLGFIKYQTLDNEEVQRLTTLNIQDYVNKHGYLYIPSLGNYIVGEVDKDQYQQDEDPDLVQPEGEQPDFLTAYQLIDPDDPKYMESEGEHTRTITKNDGFEIGDQGNIYNEEEDNIYTMVEGWHNIFIDGKYSGYSISSFGRVQNSKSGKYLKPYINKDGYITVCIFYNGKKYPRYVHRLVAEYFIPNPDKLPQVNHIDEDKENNKVWNLEWVTASENINHSKHKLEKEVQQLDPETGEVINTFKSVMEAARQLGIDNGGIGMVCRGDAKTYKGYGWRYTNPTEKGKHKEVVKYDLKTGNILGTYKNFAEAGRSLELDEDTSLATIKIHIRECCLGKLKTYKGFGFKYKDEDQDPEQE